MKKLISLFLVFLLLLGLVIAQDEASTYDARVSFDWLTSQASGGAFNDDVFTTSLAILALDSSNAVTSTYTSWLDLQMDPTNYCFPAGACKTQDTAMALIALLAVQEDSYKTEISDWLVSAQREADVSGDWLLEVTTDATGICTLSYTLGENTYDVEVAVDQGVFTDCGSFTFYDLNDCLGGAVIASNPSTEFTLDCATLEDTAIMTHLYKSSNDYYLLDSEEGDLFTFKVNNGCFGRASGDACNVEASLYSSWALEEAGSDVGNLIYLRDKYQSSNVLDNAILYFITKDNSYLDILATRQLSDGSFDRDAYNTGLAILALSQVGYDEEITAAKAWLEDNVESDGSWNQDVEATAMILYAAYGGTSVVIPTPTDECEDDFDCDENEICVAGSCVASGEPECVSSFDCADGYDCKNGVCIEESEDVCVINNVCEVNAGENSDNCFDDCFQYCGDGKCDAGETCTADCGSTSTPPPTEPPKEKNNAWVWIIIIVLLVAGLGVGGYFLWKKGLIKVPNFSFGKKSTNKPKPGYSPFTQRQQNFVQRKPVQKKSTSVDSKLDKSLEEARRLLKK